MKSVKLQHLSFLACVLLLAAVVSGQTVVRTRSAVSTVSPSFMKLSEVKEGMRGTARTVFRGTEPEEFSVEILGVVPGGIGPAQDLIVGRISGGNADRTAVFAGMSGSPVYVDGKLVGAISYSFPFSKEAICGITPIEQIVEIFEEKPASRSVAREPRPISFAEIASTSWEPRFPSAAGGSGILSGIQQGSPMMAVAGQSFQPIATPITFTGISQSTLDIFAPSLMRAGLLPVSAAGGNSPITALKKADANTLVGGASVSMQLSRGDYSMAAAGTVTLRDGERIYAFGHPFLNLGSSDVPMSESHVVTVVPSVNNSFKLAVPDAMVGAMTQDRATGVFGKLGQAPAMIPVRLNVNTSRGGTETLNIEVARDELLTPLLLNMSIYNAITAHERGFGEVTVDIKGTINIKGQSPLKVERRFAGSQAQLMAAGSVVSPVSVLLRSRFDDLQLASIVIDVASTDGTRVATLDRISVDKSEVKAGDTVDVRAYARTHSGKIYVQTIPVTIPADATPGSLKIQVGDGSQVQKDTAAQHFVPKDLSELIATVNGLRSSDRLYAVISRSSTGAVIGANELPNLPPSMLATINSDRSSGGVKPSLRTVLFESILPPSEYLITGSQEITLEVVR